MPNSRNELGKFGNGAGTLAFGARKTGHRKWPGVPPRRQQRLPGVRSAIDVHASPPGWTPQRQNQSDTARWRGNECCLELLAETLMCVGLYGVLGNPARCSGWVSRSALPRHRVQLTVRPADLGTRLLEGEPPCEPSADAGSDKALPSRCRCGSHRAMYSLATPARRHPAIYEKHSSHTLCTPPILTI